MNIIKKRKVTDPDTTMDYSIFKRAKWNRPVLEGKIRSIIESIQKHGVFEDKKIILVNDDYEIIDGQHRFEAFKRLGLPITYLIDYEASINECASLNSTSTNWKLTDYINSFASVEGDNKASYRLLRNMNRKYPLLNHTVIACISNDVSNSLLRVNYDKEIIDSIKNGTFEAKVPLLTLEEELIYISRCLTEIMKVVGTSSGHGTSKSPKGAACWINAIHFFYKTRDVDKAQLYDKLTHKLDDLYIPGNEMSAIEQLEKIYNFRNKYKLDFTAIYKAKIEKNKKNKVLKKGARR